MKIPAELPKAVAKNIQKLSLKVFEILNAEGLARVDCFLTADNRVFVNEINTFPGFTSVSMYPKLWEASGISYTDLLDRLIALALNQFQKNEKIDKKSKS